MKRNEAERQQRLECQEKALTEEQCRDEVYAHWDMLNRLARRRFMDETLAEEALLHVQDKLAANGWSRVRAYGGKASFARYIAHVSTRLMEDFARARFGRLRPPTWVRQLSGVWLDAFRLLCVERMRSMDAVEHLMDSAPGGRDQDHVESVVAEILGRIPSCGERRGLEVGMEEEVMDAVASPEPSACLRPPEEQVLEAERDQALAACRLLLGGEGDEPAGDGRFEGLVDHIRSELRMSDEERLLLGMVFGEGMNVSAAGRVLGLRSDQAHGKMRAALRRIRTVLDKAGWSGELQRLVLEET